MSVEACRCVSRRRDLVKPIRRTCRKMYARPLLSIFIQSGLNCIPAAQENQRSFRHRSPILVVSFPQDRIRLLVHIGHAFPVGHGMLSPRIISQRLKTQK